MKNFTKFVLISGVSAAVALSGGCATSDHGGRSEGRVVDDKQITEEVQDQLRREPVYKFSDVDVKTFSGVVQLSGFVNTDEQKKRAGELAQQVPGVTEIVNGISLKPQIPRTATGRQP
jgi:hyperosmotically inducible protein